MVMGIVIALVYRLCDREAKKEYIITLAVLPILVLTVIMMTSGNLGSAVAVMGAFSLIRFRSAPGTAREILFIFYSMAVGLCCGIGQVVFGGVITAAVALFFLILTKTRFGAGDGKSRHLQIRIPEDLDYTRAFQDVFEEYTEDCRRISVRTVNLGSMLDIDYQLKLRDLNREKEFLDAIRVRNGNLKVVLQTGAEREALS